MFSSELMGVNENSPNASSFSYKEADTGKYIFVSNTCAKRYGVLNCVDLIGQTMDEMLKYLQPEFAAAYQKDCEQHDFLVREKKIPVMRTCLFLGANGDVSYRQIAKHPTFDAQRNLLAIFTHGYDLTAELPYADLYKLNRHFYMEQEAIQRTLVYLGVAEYFVELPSEEQLHVFLAEAQDYLHQQSVPSLPFSEREANNHLDALCSTVIDGDLIDVLSRIHCRQPRLPDDEESE